MHNLYFFLKISLGSTAQAVLPHKFEVKTEQ